MVIISINILKQRIKIDILREKQKKQNRKHRNDDIHVRWPNRKREVHLPSSRCCKYDSSPSSTRRPFRWNIIESYAGAKTNDFMPSRWIPVPDGSLRAAIVTNWSVKIELARPKIAARKTKISHSLVGQRSFSWFSSLFADALKCILFGCSVDTVIWSTVSKSTFVNTKTTKSTIQNERRMLTDRVDGW